MVFFPWMGFTRSLAALLALLALTTLAFPAGARQLRVVCNDGDPACDLDRSCDGVCRMVVGPGEPLAVRLRKHGQAAGRRARRIGRHLLVARCLPPTHACKPALTSGCRADMDASQCAAHDGDFGRGGLAPAPSCQCRTSDAGTPCARDGDCQGLCFAPLGADAPFRCSAHVTEFGCLAILDDQGNRQALCID